ncbi:sugar ABC transporter permease [Boudabousia liubingyangii]|uniref:Xylose transport system permease protein XylH n=1 Tax=Boudabousia liubingyangii TaxID=1921764 RepID=A0A1Q5PMU6_9ACTO|nr:multiple monosaccharide ABC transporter permease [Boudabousia liubingyangii]OKL47456.1 sugar ABC transporter permease [Boudabousia liubingyangii]OKL48878.1 sugar ABC transporter permease [Boudabousia liubingyangii]
MSNLSKKLGINVREYGILGALVIIIIFFQAISKGSLLDPNNVASLIQQNAYVMILAIGMTMVIIARHIDLSVGSTVGLVGGIVAYTISQWALSWPLAILLGLVVGAVIGAWQGFWVAYVGVPAFIVTLGGMLIFRGLTILLVARTISSLPTGFNAIANGSVPNWLGFAGDLDVVTLILGAVTILAFVYSSFRSRQKKAAHAEETISMGLWIGQIVLVSLGIGYLTYLLALSAGGTPIVLVIIGVLVVLYSLLMGRTVFGRHIYAVGGNLKAAQLSGVNTKRVDFMVFVNMGILAALAGVVTTARSGAAVSNAGNMFELDAIAAAFIGGTAVSGGKGKISGAIIGALIMGVLNMGLSILSVDPAWQQVIKGLVVILAVAVDIVSSRRNN